MLEPLQGLGILFQKLGHPLPEIRCRALKSIVSKLDHGLLHESNLINERQLLIKLLEWFNFHPAPMKEEVLNLMLLLSKHAHAKELLISLGAVRFLTDLRKDILCPSLKGDLDKVLENLLHTTENVSYGDRCLYRGLDSTQDDTVILSHATDVTPLELSGYFEGMTEEAISQNKSAIGQDDTNSFITYPGFPWHFLTATDRHVLSSTSVSLCSSNSNLVQNACTFLLDVVLCDFPTEIFIQRPTIVNTVLTLLRSQPGYDLTLIACECLSYISRNLLGRILFFQDPNFHCPRQGLPLSQGSLFDSYHIRQYSEMDEERQQRNGGDGRDENSSSSMSSTFESVLRPFQGNHVGEAGTDEDDSLEDGRVDALQLAQLTPHYFCVSCLQTAIPLLLVDSPTLFLQAYELSLRCIQLLSHILDPNALWKASHNKARDFQSDIGSLANVISRSLLYHYHLECEERQSHVVDDPRQDSEEWSVKTRSKYESEFHRVSFQACSSLLILFLKSVVPVKYSQAITSDLVTVALYTVACDEPLAVASPSFREVGQAFLCQCDQEKHGTLSKLLAVSKSITDTQLFLAVEKGSNKDYNTLLGFAESALHALPYYAEDSFVPRLIDVISEACVDVCNPLCGAAERILLKLLAHPLLNVRSNAYQACHKVSSSAISVASAAEDPSRHSTFKCAFLMTTPVLTEIVLHGVCDSSSLVNSPAQDLILCLIRGKLLMEVKVWAFLVNAMKPVIPALQTLMSDNSLMSVAITEFIMNSFDLIDVLEFLLRCLLLKQRSVRANAGERLSKMLNLYRNELAGDTKQDESNSMTSLLDYAGSIIDLIDLLIVDKPLALMCSPVSGACTVDATLFPEEAGVRMLEIFRSKTMAWPVRRSALQQLSVILNDHYMHSAFVKSDGLKSVKSRMLSLATNSVLTDTENDEALACVSIVKSVAFWNLNLRKSFIEVDMLLGLLKLSDLCRLFPTTANLISQTLALLLLHDVILLTEEEDGSLREPSLPSKVVSCYQIPFLCNAHDVVSKNRTVSSPTHCDPLLSGPAAFAIRCQMMLARNCRKVDIVVDNLHSHGASSGSHDKISTQAASSGLLAERTAVIYSNALMAVEHIVSTVQKASAHAAVSHSLYLFRILLRSNPEVYSGVMFNSASWRKAVEKFLLVLPSSSKDIELLCEVVGMVGDLLETRLSTSFTSWESESYNEAIKDTLLWYLRLCVPGGPATGHLSEDMPLFALLQTFEVLSEQTGCTESSVPVQRRLSKGILAMVSSVSRRMNAIKDDSIVCRFQAILCQIILLRLKLADAPRFYDLPSMEVTLECLVHNTALTGWTKGAFEFYRGMPDSTTLCTQLLGSLLEVVSAFHIENHGSSMSYMGKGVSISATRGILHLVFELHSEADIASCEIPGWLNIIAHSLTPSGVNEDESCVTKSRKTSFEWILALWSARDPRIRYSGLALGAAVTSSPAGCELAKSNFHKYGGIWNITFSVIFDNTECSAVRAQAAALISNLVYHSFKPDGVDGDFVLFVRLLNRIRFSHNVASLLARYHSSYLIQPVTIVYSPFLPSATATTSETSLQSGTDHSQPGARYGHQQLKEQLSENSYVSDLPIEWQAVCTPVLVTAICRLIRSMIQFSKDLMIMLARDTIIKRMAHMVNYQVLMSCIGECMTKFVNDNVTKGRLSLMADSLIEQFSEACKTLHVYVLKDRVAAMSVIKEADVVENCVNLMTVIIIDEPWCQKFLRMQQSIADLLSCVLLHCGSEAATIIAPNISNAWPSFSRTVRYILTQKYQAPLLSVMTLLSNLLSSLVKFNGATHLMETGFWYSSAESDMIIFSSILVGIFESHVVKKDLQVMGLLGKCADALQASFSAYPLTKVKAWESGFLNSVIGEMKHLHGQLELLSLNGTLGTCQLKAANGDVQSTTDHFMRKLLLLLRVIGSLIGENEDIQNSASGLEFGLILEKLWSLIAVFPKLKSHILKVVTCYTYNCNQACSSVSVATVCHQPFVNHIISEARDLNSKILVARKVQLNHLQTVYQIVCNLSVSRECRSLVWKSGILREFIDVADRGQHPKSTKQQRLLLLNWLKMFHSLSYFADGQMHILKIFNILEIFSSISDSTNFKELVMKILCNLCYHGPSKPRISSSKAALNMLSKGLACTLWYSTASALWALLSNNQKSKVHLKVAGMAPVVHSALVSKIQKTAEKRDMDAQLRLTAILDVMQT